MALRNVAMQLNRRAALRLGLAGGAMAALGPAKRVAWAAAPTNNDQRNRPRRSQ